MSGNKKLFLSAATSEFGAYRDLLADDLKRPTLDVAVQQDFGVIDGTTLEKLDRYIQACDGVVHLIGKAAGSAPEEPAVAELLGTYKDFATRLPSLAERLGRPQPGFTYTQWEAYLALYHRRPLFVYLPADFARDKLHVPRGTRFAFDEAEAQQQGEHYGRICELGHDRGEFANEERLSSAVLRDLVDILPRLEESKKIRPTRLPHTAERLVGRDEELTMLDRAWRDPQKNVVVIRAFGGMGKTSLVATWRAELALKGWRGAEHVFDWSFYSQGTKEQTAASADTFIAAALREFGDPDPTLGSPWDRGARLARLVGESRCLLVLDGLEPLQYPPGPMQGQLKDQGVEALLKGLVAQNEGLCVVTTREKVEDIQQHYGLSAADVELAELSDLAGASLLHHSGATRAGAKVLAPDGPELQTASSEVRGHGLTLLLLGQYLRLVEDGDILKRDTVRLADADKEYKNDATRPYGHAFKAMEAYERWFGGGGELEQRQLAVLRLLGLFDRPAPADCLDALRAEPAIIGLTEPLVDIPAREWKLVLNRLADINLLTVQHDGSVDAHPLLREYFGMRLREFGELWRAAHRRLFEHLCETTEEGDEPTLEDLQPLYQAVTHGCHAGLQQKALDEVYFARINRQNESYSSNKLGAIGSNLGAVACFFQTPWSGVTTSTSEADQAWLLSEAAFCLRGLGRLTEALEPFQLSRDMAVRGMDWKASAVRAGNLSELEMTLGHVAASVERAEQSVNYADRSGDAVQRMFRRTTHADALHQAGRPTEAESLFGEAEQMQAEHQPERPLLYSFRGFQYCDLLLAEAERAAWTRTLASVRGSDQGAISESATRPDLPKASAETLGRLLAVSERARRLFEWRTTDDSLVEIALDDLILVRAALYQAILKASSLSDAGEIEESVSALRGTGHQQHLPLGLLTRAWQRTIAGKRTGIESAQTDLDEAWEIAAHGPMPLFQIDVHLHRARLFADCGVGDGTEEPASGTYPWESPKNDLYEARGLIKKHGYGRRLPELEDAEAAILGGVRKLSV